MQPKTIPTLLYERCRKTPDGIAHYSLGSDGKWQPHCWKEYYSDVTSLAKGLLELGLTPGQNIGIMAPASRQWDVMQLAILFCGGVVVGLDPHDAAENINNIANRSDLQGLVAGDVSLLGKIDAALRSKLKFIVSIAEETPAGSGAENIFPIKEFLQNGGLDIASHLDMVKTADPATIIFTSGTTGTPKGIQYSHNQVVIACGSILESFADISEGARLACWLPLSNLYQRIINFCAIVVGAATYYVENPRQVLQHLPEINPHIFLGVPRFFEKLHAGILENIDNKSPMARILAHWALETGVAYNMLLRQKKTPGFLAAISFKVADTMILERIRRIMGSNLQYMISGSAPISRWLLEQFHGMGFLILEAYGISENIIPIAVNRPASFKFGTVGKPLPGNEVKFTDDGELLVKGSGVFSGYYNDNGSQCPLTEDGFLATGDYAAFDAEGFMVLTGRKSEIFKTSTGRRVSPVRIEELLGRLSYVEHAVVFGAGKPFLVALLSVDQRKLSECGTRAKSVIGGTAENILSEWNDIIARDVLNGVAELQGYLQPAGLLISGAPFSIEGGELTANLKIRRQVILAKYQRAIAALYDDITGKQQARNNASGRGGKMVIHWL